MDIDESYMTYYAGEPSDHFDGEKFFNPWNKRPKKGIWDVLKWRMEGNRSEWPESVENPPRPPLTDRSEPLKVTYIGHATILVQVANINLLVDPVFSERCSPFAHIGPKRVTQPFVPLEKLPKIDFVFVSHNHYDHLDLASLSWLAEHHKPMIYTPLGNTRIMKPCTKGCTMMALDWHQRASLGEGLSLTLVPSQHWSRRGLNDINRDLWSGFVLKDEKRGKSIYYCGDSGFDSSLFEGIRQRHSTPDIALLPIGAYEPRWFMKYSHMNPDDAIQAYKILGAKRGMGFHFETFQLTDEAFDAPREHTLAALKKHDVRDGDFMIPYPGDFVTI